MKRNILILAAVFILIGGVAYADSILPDEAEQFYDDCGHVCYVWPDGSGDCYPCLECEGCDVCEPTPVPTNEPTREPTLLPPPIATTEKQKCNRGLGNGSENCDPGNSGGNPGAAGEGNE